MGGRGNGSAIRGTWPSRGSTVDGDLLSTRKVQATADEAPCGLGDRHTDASAATPRQQPHVGTIVQGSWLGTGEGRVIGYLQNACLLGALVILILDWILT